MKWPHSQWQTRLLLKIAKIQVNWKLKSEIHPIIMITGCVNQLRNKSSTRRRISGPDSIRSSGALYSSICPSKVSSSSSGIGEAFKSIATIIHNRPTTFTHENSKIPATLSTSITCYYLCHDIIL